MSWEHQERYERWWKGKLCRFALRGGEFKRVTKVELVGPHSFVYGSVWLHFEGGEKAAVPCGDAFKPRKFDVEVKEESASCEPDGALAHGQAAHNAQAANTESSARRAEPHK